MEDAPVLDLGRAAEFAITSMLAAGRVVGRDGDGRKVLEVPVDDWIVDWFSPPRPRPSKVAQEPAGATPDHSSSR